MAQWLEKKVHDPMAVGSNLNQFFLNIIFMILFWKAIYDYFV